MHVPAAIGRYPVTGLVGTGAFAAVYRAVDERIGTEVAIKLLADHHSLDPDVRERFIAEARLLRRVITPYVVRLYELDETERHQPYLVMELVPGGNLATRRRGLLAEPGVRVSRLDVTTVAGGVTAALTALHAERIVHRDLSPTNLLLRRRAEREPSEADGLFADGDQLVLADLGLSKDLARSSGLTAAAGTDGFAAPEQRRAGVVDERADVYAASALLTWFILGREPGGGATAEFAGAGWPAALGTVLDRGLADDPADRPASIEAWHDAVMTAIQPPPVPPPSTIAEPTSRRRRVVRIAAPLAVAAALGAGVAYGIDELVDGRDDDGGGDATTTEIGDGMVRVEQVGDDVTAAFEGPATMVLGETATYRADVGGAASWVWLDSRGNAVADTAALDVRPTSTGRLTLTLVTVGADGETATARGEFTVEDAPGE
jgi:eukaryotic-like serine/threonine-protein kinase